MKPKLTSNGHAAVKGNTVMAKGNSKTMHKLVKANGGNKAGWFVGVTNKPVGAPWKSEVS